MIDFANVDPRPEHCAGCGAPRAVPWRIVMCPSCWAKVPDDVRARVKWAVDEGPTELAAAAREAVEAMFD